MESRALHLKEMAVVSTAAAHAAAPAHAAAHAAAHGAAHGTAHAHAVAVLQVSTEAAPVTEAIHTALTHLEAQAWIYI
jgi:hypothetical protein